MTLAQKLRQEGHQEGRQEGKIVALRENVIEALEVRFGEIPQGLRDALGGISDESMLRHLLRSAIQASTLAAFSVDS